MDVQYYVKVRIICTGQEFEVSPMNQETAKGFTRMILSKPHFYELVGYGQLDD